MNLSIYDLSKSYHFHLIFGREATFLYRQCTHIFAITFHFYQSLLIKVVNYLKSLLLSHLVGFYNLNHQVINISKYFSVLLFSITDHCSKVIKTYFKWKRFHFVFIEISAILNVIMESENNPKKYSFGCFILVPYSFVYLFIF